MGLFGKSKDNNRDRKEIKNQVDKLMEQYDKEEIDGASFAQGIFDLQKNPQKKKRR